MLQWLHGHHFASLSLHWSRIVRSAFLYIVLVKVLHHGDGVADNSGSQISPTSSVAHFGHGGERRSSFQTIADAGAGRSRSEPTDIFSSLRADGAEPRGMGTASKSVSSNSLARVREVEYEMLRRAYENSLADISALCEAGAEEGRRLVDDGRSFATRKAYARFANAEFLQLQHKWEELQECLTRYPIPDRNAEADQRHAPLFAGGWEDRRREPGHGSNGNMPHQRNRLTPSLNILSDTSDEEDDGTSDEW